MVGLLVEHLELAVEFSEHREQAIRKLAVDGPISFSTVRLRLVTSMGLFWMFIAALSGSWLLTLTIYQMIFGG